MNTPFFSIIVVSLNAEKYIQMTLDSILFQTFDDYEVVIKDGLSSDNTLKLIPNDRHISVYSEQDNSVYDGMNQATEYAKGEYLVYMNCGDIFADKTVLSNIRKAIGNREYSMVYGDCIRKGVLFTQPTILSLYYLYRKPINHQSIFFNRKIVKDLNLYNTQYRIIADHDLELKIYKTGIETLHVNMAICVYQGGGLSETASGEIRRRKERKDLIRSHFSTLERVKYGIRWHITLPYIRQFLVSDSTPLTIRKIYQELVAVKNHHKLQ